MTTRKPHDHIEQLRGPALLGRPLATPARLATRAVYASIDGITQLVGSGLDVALAQLAPLVDATAPGAQRELVLAVLNGVLGDYLHETGNPLAIELELRRAGRTLELTPDALRAAIPDPTAKLVVLVHGSCMTDAQFTRAGHDHGAALARDLGFTPLYLRYTRRLPVHSPVRRKRWAVTAVSLKLGATRPERRGSPVASSITVRIACGSSSSSAMSSVTRSRWS